MLVNGEALPWLQSHPMYVTDISVDQIGWSRRTGSSETIALPYQQSSGVHRTHRVLIGYPVRALECSGEGLRWREDTRQEIWMQGTPTMDHRCPPLQTTVVLDLPTWGPCRTLHNHRACVGLAEV